MNFELFTKFQEIKKKIWPPKNPDPGGTTVRGIRRHYRWGGGGFFVKFFPPPPPLNYFFNYFHISPAQKALTIRRPYTFEKKSSKMRFPAPRTTLSWLINFKNVRCLSVSGMDKTYPLFSVYFWEVFFNFFGKKNTLFFYQNFQSVDKT